MTNVAKQNDWPQLEKDNKIRAQIMLTVSLKRLIEAKRRLAGENLSEYLRKAAWLRILSEEEEKKELKQLAKILIGSVSLKNHPEWQNKKKLGSWLKNLREGWQ
ncbi:hypothetical protein ISS42_01520 [Candidatus Shapirobacteria bacterium]|nr:hypothetical protein [Candidatus Shapirobacteria bacterium]